MGNKVLVVEDNLDNMKLVIWILEDENYVVIGVNCVEDCFFKLDNEEFDVVLMDILLFGIDGKEVICRLWV